MNIKQVKTKKKTSSIRLRLMLLKRTSENISWAEKEIQKFKSALFTKRVMVDAKEQFE